MKKKTPEVWRKRCLHSHSACHPCVLHERHQHLSSQPAQIRNICVLVLWIFRNAFSISCLLAFAMFGLFADELRSPLCAHPKIWQFLYVAVHGAVLMFIRYCVETENQNLDSADIWWNLATSLVAVLVLFCTFDIVQEICQCIGFHCTSRCQHTDVLRKQRTGKVFMSRVFSVDLFTR